jgi:stage II sporulation protein GA (sporulation sigma-E factor processing peptidase)
LNKKVSSLEPGVLYLDVLLLTFFTNMLFDWLLLWATAEVTKVKSGKWRLISGALLGSLHYTLYFLASFQVIDGYGLLRSPVTVLAVSLAMLALAFRKELLTQFFRIFGTFYLIFFISSGAGLAVGSILGSATRPKVFTSNLVSVIAILLVAELGWGVVQKRIWRGLYHVPLEIYLNDKKVGIVALIDTGNQLIDPVSKAQVIVVEFSRVKELFSPDLHHDLYSLSEGNLESIQAFINQSSFCSRFKVIPFSSLGNEHGLMIGFKPDAVQTLHPKPLFITSPCVIGITSKKLIKDGSYQGLLPPSLLSSTVEDKASPLTDVDINPDESGEKVADLSL